MPDKVSVGIDDIAVYIPKLWIDARDFSEDRGIPLGKLHKGLGVYEWAVPDSYEDPATMGAMAVLELMERNDIKPSEISYIETATESSKEASKSMSSYMIEMLEMLYGDGSFAHVGAPERKFACVAGTYSLIDRMAYIASGWRPKRKYHIMVATDIAKYALRGEGEETQGAAAAAVLISKNPRLMKFEPESLGYATRPDKDFFKPESGEIPIVDGHVSMGCYLRDCKIAIVESVESMLENELIVLSEGETILDYLDGGIAYHTPFSRMPEYAYASIKIHFARNTPQWKKIVEKIGPEPSREGMTDFEYYMSKEYNDYRRALVKLPEFQEEFMKKVGPSLAASRRVGNSYTASLYVCLDSLFENSEEDLAGKRIGIESYGSGSSAITASFIVQPEYKEVVKKMTLMKKLDSRTEKTKLPMESYVNAMLTRKFGKSRFERLKKRVGNLIGKFVKKYANDVTIPPYEALHRGELHYPDTILEPHQEFALVNIGTDVNDWGYRYYDWIE